MAKTALVISGGGSKGAFAVGVVRELANSFPDINFDILVGTSTGALIVPMVASEELDLLERLYTTVKTEDIIIKGNIVTRVLGDVSLFDAKPLGNLLKEYYNEARSNAILQSGKQIYLATVCLQTGKAVYFATQTPPIVTDYEVVKLNNVDEFRRAVMASACQPVFMQPIEVKKGSLPLRQYVDGGVREYAGIQLAIDAGAEEIFVILHSAGGDEPDEKMFDSSLNVLFKTIDIFTADVGYNDLKIPAVYNRALRYIDAVKQKMKTAGVPAAKIDEYFNIPFNNPFTGKKPIKIHLIRPNSPLGGGPGGLTFDSAEMKRMLAKGRTQLSDYMANLPPDGSGNI
jgi:NTE family protein